VTALANALVGHKMVEAYVRVQGGKIQDIAADGWCLLTCMAQATGEVDVKTLFAQALNFIPALATKALAVLTIQGGLTEEAAATWAAVQVQALALLEKLQQRRGLDVRTLWNSELWECLPQVLSMLTGRVLYILQGRVGNGLVNVRVIDETDGKGCDLAIIQLVRCYDEYGLDHYELVTFE
jgi:hypothetical protein